MKALSVRNYQTPTGEVNTLPSLTVPDQAVSLYTLLENHVKGLPVMRQPQPAFYDPDNEFPDLKKLDLVEIQELSEKTQNFVQKMQQKLQEIRTFESEQNNVKNDKDTSEKEPENSDGNEA